MERCPVCNAYMSYKCGGGWHCNCCGWDTDNIQITYSDHTFNGEIIKDCNNCKYCKPKEIEQTKDKEPHVCVLINKRLFHDSPSQHHYCIKSHIKCPLIRRE